MSFTYLLLAIITVHSGNATQGILRFPPRPPQRSSDGNDKINSKMNMISRLNNDSSFGKSTNYTDVFGTSSNRDDSLISDKTVHLSLPQKLRDTVHRNKRKHKDTTHKINILHETQTNTPDCKSHDSHSYTQQSTNFSTKSVVNQSDIISIIPSNGNDENQSPKQSFHHYRRSRYRFIINIKQTTNKTLEFIFPVLETTSRINPTVNRISSKNQLMTNPILQTTLRTPIYHALRTDLSDNLVVQQSPMKNDSGKLHIIDDDDNESSHGESSLFSISPISSQESLIPLQFPDTAQTAHPLEHVFRFGHVSTRNNSATINNRYDRYETQTIRQSPIVKRSSIASTVSEQLPDQVVRSAGDDSDSNHDDECVKEKLFPQIVKQYRQQNSREKLTNEDWIKICALSIIVENENEIREKVNDKSLFPDLFARISLNCL
eukprot:121445_1